MRQTRPWMSATITVLVVGVIGLSPLRVWGQTLSSPLQMKEPQRVALIVGKSVVLDSPVPIRRASLANPDVADAIVLSPRQLYLTGKSVGGTNLTLWQENGSVWGVFDLDVGPDLTRIKEQLHDVFPGEKDIQVTAAKDHLTLSGAISSTSHLSQVLSIAESYAPKKVINLLQVAGVQQVMLEVRVAEMSRELLRRLGVNFNYTEGNKFAVSQLGALTNTGGGTIGPNGTPFDVLLTQAVTALFRFQTGSITWTGFIDALKQNNIVKILAEPTLVALSGQEASFLAGGEFPIPVPQALGVISIRFKQFGASLTFTPTVLANNKISIAVAPEVSDLDFTNAINIQGFLIPAITTRRASSVVELDDGQSFAIAGLLRDTVRQQISKFPFLGDIPILGALFRSSRFQKDETELVIIATPRLVKPLDMAKQTLPTSQYIEPSDFDFYLMGQMEGSDRNRVRRTVSQQTPKDGGFEGEFGHTIP